MTEAHEYPAYRARLVRVVYGVMTINKLWGEWVRLDQWREYRREELLQRFRPPVWELSLARSRRLTRFEIEAIDEVGRTIPLSTWRLKELERQSKTGQAIPEPQTPEAVAEWMGRVRTVTRPKPGLGEGAAHLVDHLPGYREEVALLILRKYNGRTDMFPDDLRNHLKNGRKRTGECRFCNSVVPRRGSD